MPLLWPWHRQGSADIKIYRSSGLRRDTRVPTQPRRRASPWRSGARRGRRFRCVAPQAPPVPRAHATRGPPAISTCNGNRRTVASRLPPTTAPPPCSTRAPGAGPSPRCGCAGMEPPLVGSPQRCGPKGDVYHSLGRQLGRANCAPSGSPCSNSSCGRGASNGAQPHPVSPRGLTQCRRR